MKKILEEILNIDLIGATLSNPRKKEEIVKVKVRPVLIKDVLFFQCETHKNRQVFHENYEYEQALHILTQDMELFRQMHRGIPADADRDCERGMHSAREQKGEGNCSEKKNKGGEAAGRIIPQPDEKLYFEGRDSGSVFTRSRSYDGRWEGCPE